MRVLEKILEAARKQGHSQQSLEDAAGLPQGRISKLKSSAKQDPAWSEVLRLAKVVALPLDFLADDKQDEPRQALSLDEALLLENARIIGIGEANRRVLLADHVPLFGNVKPQDQNQTKAARQM